MLAFFLSLDILHILLNFHSDFCENICLENVTKINLFTLVMESILTL